MHEGDALHFSISRREQIFVCLKAHLHIRLSKQCLHVATATGARSNREQAVYCSRHHTSQERPAGHSLNINQTRNPGEQPHAPTIIEKVNDLLTPWSPRLQRTQAQHNGYNIDPLHAVKDSRQLYSVKPKC